ncbi:hypothetical protein SSS_10161 [Sarcoptes scabiei]|uniref:Uncharacterized protein n=1 Tax=Sarcoptes scabiei TaxID=52283 RepID=A0A834VGX7_SARSC|nr:hypothetical protein SSS_10161 [Sarcoptes scabiei]
MEIEAQKRVHTDGDEDDDDEFLTIDLNSSIISKSNDDGDHRLFPSSQLNANKHLLKEDLVSLSKRLVEDYLDYFRLKPINQKERLNECIENLLTHMEEFYGLIDRLRNENRRKCQTDFFRGFPYEREISKAEVFLGLNNSAVSKVKKIFSILGTSSLSSSSSSTFSSLPSSLVEQRARSHSNAHTPIEIFKTEKLFNFLHSNTE